MMNKTNNNHLNRININNIPKSKKPVNQLRVRNFQSLNSLHSKNKNYSFLDKFVLIPNGRYSGQKLTILVKTNTPAKISSMIPKDPEIVPVK